MIRSLPDKNDESKGNGSNASEVSLVNQDESSIDSLFISNSVSKFNINVSRDENGNETYSIPELDSSQKISEVEAKAAIKNEPIES